LGREEILLLLILTSALHTCERPVSRPGRALPPGKEPRYPLDSRLGGPHTRSGHRGYRKNPFAFTGDKTPIARSSRPQSDTVLTELPRLPVDSCKHGNTHLQSIKDGEFLYQRSNYNFARLILLHGVNPLITQCNEGLVMF
jgi:hypothetical protein